MFSHALIEHQSFTVDFNPNCSEFMTLNGQQDYLYLNKTNELHLWIMQNTSYEVYSAPQNESVIFSWPEKSINGIPMKQRTIRQRLEQVFTLNSNNKWIDIIDDVINSYNNSFHRSIKMKPVDVKMEHVVILRHRLNYNGNIKPAKFKVGDKVRIIKKKKRFEKEYKPSWTDEIFIINKLNPTNPITYMLIDNNGENIIGSFYHEELQHVN